MDEDACGFEEGIVAIVAIVAIVTIVAIITIVTIIIMTINNPLHFYKEEMEGMSFDKRVLMPLLGDLIATHDDVQTMNG